MMRALVISLAVVACSGAYMGLTTRALPLGATLSRRAIVPVSGSPASPASPASFGFKAYNKQALNMMLDKPSPEKQPKRAEVFSLKRTLATLEVKEAAYQKQLRFSPQKRKVTRPPVQKQVLALCVLASPPPSFHVPRRSMIERSASKKTSTGTSRSSAPLVPAIVLAGSCCPSESFLDFHSPIPAP